MRPFILTCLLTLFLPFCSEGRASADEGSVREAINAYVIAFNSKDLATIETLWGENAVHIDQQSGERTTGRGDILKDIQSVFKNTSTLSLAGSVENVRIIKDDVATVDGTVMLSTGGTPTVNQFSAILLKRDGQWTIDTLEERAINPPATAANALRELDWLVGEWQDTTSETPVRVLVKSAIGGSFLVRSFEANLDDGAPLQSTQIIGWDPRAQLFRSWTFNADGSFGDGLWTRNNDQWMIKSTQTLADGRAASGTYVMTLQNADAFTVQLVGREIEGEPQPASEVVTVERVVEEANSTTTSPNSN